MATVEDRMKKIIANLFEVQESDVTPIMAWEDLEALAPGHISDGAEDGLMAREAILAVEEEFEIEIPEEEESKITGVQAAIAYVNARTL
ncbi:acyl carrier protein [Streptomyces sp. NPDC008122]|uniref:acyl carrier protein n=1 Tax=Streptomyces sp. NPDC008122 TaxID=3364810 RepID=UPI0036EEF32E